MKWNEHWKNFAKKDLTFGSKKSSFKKNRKRIRAHIMAMQNF